MNYICIGVEIEAESPANSHRVQGGWGLSVIISLLERSWPKNSSL